MDYDVVLVREKVVTAVAALVSAFNIKPQELFGSQKLLMEVHGLDCRDIPYRYSGSGGIADQKKAALSHGPVVL